MLLALLAQLVERYDSASAPREPGETVPVPIRLPPSQTIGVTGRMYPLRMDTAPLMGLAAEQPHLLAAMIDCLLDGPPQHALANALMVNLLGVLLAQLEPRAK